MSETAGAITQFVGGAETGGRLALLEVRVGHDSLLPLHRHHWEDEIIYVLEGEVRFSIDGRQQPGPAGTCVLLPRGSEHSYAVESTEARLLIIVAPAGLEQLYDEQSRSGVHAGAAVEWLVTTGAKYGVEVTGPPPAPLRRDGHIPSSEHDRGATSPVRTGGSHVD
jgi:quercetin dioxygenase-like cupin family protein